MAALVAFGVALVAVPGGPAAAQPNGSPVVRWVRCSGHHPGVRCGYIRVPLDRHDPALGPLDVYFELYPHTSSGQALEPIVAVEGGPGYSSTSSRSYYVDLFTPLMDRRDLLLVDLRGTGRSGAVVCRALQSYRGPYDREAAACGRSLGDAADLYGSHNAADDVAAVLDALGIDRVDMYGDSYGTFFSQTFAVRHPDRVRSVVLDSAYAVQWYDPWYSDTNRAMVDAYRWACQRWPTCLRRGDTMRRIVRLLDAVRTTPISGTAPDADGKLHHVTIDPGTVAQLMADGATAPGLYRELDAASRAALASPPDTLPLLRLLAENTWWGTGGAPRDYSEGLYVAVSCNDYPLSYDMTRAPGVRRSQYRGVIADLRLNDPRIFGPFRVDEWVGYPEHYWDICLGWPSPSRIDPPVPPGAHYPKVPVLILSGDLDSLTSPEGARAAAAAFPNSTFVSVVNSTHVTALGDLRACASRIVLRFVATLSAGDTSCASRYAPNRLVDAFARHASDLPIGSPRRRTAVIAADTVADVLARWWDMFGSTGVGLRGGTFAVSGADNLLFDLSGVRWVDDVEVNGTIQWDRTTGSIAATVAVDGPGSVPGKLTMRWSDWAELPQARVDGTLGGQRVSYTFLAP
jgi:pimeloyl-ACP methyl ester carboxylesterase